MAVYLIKEADTESPIKIGKAKDPYKRLMTLQIGNPNRLEIAALIYTKEGFSDCHLEGMFHGAFKDKNVSGEWFDLRLVDVLKHYESDSFSVIRKTFGTSFRTSQAQRLSSQKRKKHEPRKL